MEFSDISGAEPPLPLIIHKKVLPVLVFVFVVAHCNVRTADQNLSPGVGLVRTVVTT